MTRLEQMGPEELLAQLGDHIKESCVECAYDHAVVLEALRCHFRRGAKCEEVLAAYRVAGGKFIRKVNTGLARSRETYADFQQCEALAKAALNEEDVPHDTPA